MSPQQRSPEQLNVPLVWEVEPPPEPDARDDDPFPPGGPVTAGFGQLLAAAVLDAGVVILAVGGSWLAAAARGATLLPSQLLTAGILGLEVASVAAVTGLMGWRGTPGMLLASACFREPIALLRAATVWAAWLASLPLLGLPLLVAWGGRRVLERLGGSPLTRRCRGAAA